MTNKEIIKKFNKELNKWLESEIHKDDCAAYSEGQLCCLDKGHTKWHLDGKRRETGREFVINFIRKYNLYN